MSETRIVDVGDLVRRDESFKRNVSRSARAGRYVFKCRKGLWMVSSPDEERAKLEAWHYFLQYYEDGEYAA